MDYFVACLLLTALVGIYTVRFTTNDQLRTGTDKGNLTV